MAESKYAVIERERRFLVRAVPDAVRQVVGVDDYYIDGTRLRLRVDAPTRPPPISHRARGVRLALRGAEMGGGDGTVSGPPVGSL